MVKNEAVTNTVVFLVFQLLMRNVVVLLVTTMSVL